MSRDERETALRELYAGLRRADARRAPGFEESWRAAVRRVGERPRPVFGLVATATATVVVITVAFVLLVAPFGSDSFPAPTLSEWQAPTDTFLEIPGIEWLRTMPTIEAGLPGLTWDGPTQETATSSSRRLES
jgi:hypothetical protein